MTFPLRALVCLVCGSLISLACNWAAAQTTAAPAAKWVSPRRGNPPAQRITPAVQKPIEKESEPADPQPYSAKLVAPAVTAEPARTTPVVQPLARQVAQPVSQPVAARPAYRPARRPPVAPAGHRPTTPTNYRRTNSHRQGEVIGAEELPPDVRFEHGSAMEDYGHGPGCGCDSCATECCDTGCHVCDDWCWSQDLTLFAGTQGFKSAPDRGQNGNFGFHEGINWGGPLWNRFGIGYQVGALVTHSDLSGTQVNGTFNDDPRSQAFLTAGFFRRGDEFNRLQMGFAGDWLRDEYLIDVNLTQVRAELSYFLTPRNEVGFAGAFNAKADSGRVVTTQEEWTPVEQYTVFWRHRLSTTAETRLLAGTTGEGDGLFGGQAYVAMSPRFAFQGAFMYLNPGGGTTDAASLETWGISMNIIWYPGQSAFRSVQSLYRPLFNVADNSSFLIGRETP